MSTNNKVTGRWLLSILTLCATLAVVPANARDYDVLIRGGLVVDGTGAPRFDADVGIRGDRIVEIGVISQDATAKKVINATGKVVSPGFIDPHSHAAPGIGTEGLVAAAPILYQGITSVLLNPDGGGPADIKPQIDILNKLVPGTNVALMIGHNAVRNEVMGAENRAPTANEQKQMEELVKNAMESGAFGLSSGPFYVPGKYSKTDEIVGLAKVAANYPDSFHTSHIRDESNYDITVLGAIGELIQISREAGIPGIVTHMKMLGPPVWGDSLNAIDMINAARDEGLEIWADQYAYAASATGLQPALVPGWAQAGGKEAMIARLMDPEQREKIRDEMAKNLERRAGPHSVLIRDYPDEPNYVGMRLDEISRQREEDPLDTAIYMLTNGGAPIISFNMNERDVEAIMRQTWTMTCSDGALTEPGKNLEHPRAYGAFPRKIRHYVLDRGVLSLEQAIHASAGLTAQVHGIKDRGVLRKGAFADVLVIDLDKVRDKATYQEPELLAVGMDYVLVNGEVAIDNGKLDQKRFGRVLLRPH